MATASASLIPISTPPASTSSSASARIAVKFALNDYLWGRCLIPEAAYDVTDKLGTAHREPHPKAALFLIPSSINTGEIARVLREGYDVGLLSDGFRALGRELQLDYLLIDTHPGVNEETLLSIAVSDQLLLILRPDNQDFQGTAVAVELARRLDVRNLKIILNKVPPGADWDLLRARVESAYQAPVIGMMPLCNEMAQVASGSLFINRYPAHPFTVGLKRVADSLRA